MPSVEGVSCSSHRASGEPLDISDRPLARNLAAEIGGTGGGSESLSLLPSPPNFELIRAKSSLGKVAESKRVIRRERRWSRG